MSLMSNFWYYITQKIRPFFDIDMNGKKISWLPTSDYPTADGDGATKKYVDDSAPSGIPAGVICMWSGIIGNIPAGWALCDGGDGRPDLRSKFIRGAASGQNPGGTGGSDTINIPGHSHTVNSHTHSGGSLGFRLAGTRTVTGSIGPHHISSNTGVNNMWFSPNNWYGATGGAAPGTDTKNFNAIDNKPSYYALAFIIKT